MRSRHAAALALVVWYLMIPPNKKDDAPLSEWIVWRSFDSTEACQSAQTVYRDQSSAKLRQYDSMTDQQRANISHNQKALEQEMADNDNFDNAWHSACIAKDDPRLKGN